MIFPIAKPTAPPAAVPAAGAAAVAKEIITHAIDEKLRAGDALQPHKSASGTRELSGAEDAVLILCEYVLAHSLGGLVDEILVGADDHGDMLSLANFIIGADYDFLIIIGPNTV